MIGVEAPATDFISTVVTIGGVIVAVIVAAYGRFKNPSSAPLATRADVIEVFVREQSLTRELLTRIVTSNEAMVAIMQSSALEDRIAREIANRFQVRNNNRNDNRNEDR